MDRYFLGATILVGILSLGIAFVVTRRILSPLSHLAGMARRISTGDYSARVPHAQRGEFAQVTSAFNQMAASLQRTDELRRSLVSNVAHELRTPLTNVRGYLEALQDGVMPPSTETYQVLHDETLRVVQLVDDLLRLARAEAANADMAVEEVDVDQLLQQVVKLFELQLNSKDLRVQVSTEEIRVPVIADRRKLTQVLTNLLENACRFTPDGEQISVCGERNHEHVKLTFSNPCAPIEDEERELLFERFYRREKSRSREWGGAGIGLAIVKELVEAHGGSVGLDTCGSEIDVWFSIPYRSRVHREFTANNEQSKRPSVENSPPAYPPGLLRRQYQLPDAEFRDQAIRIGDSAGMRIIIPVGRSLWAILAGYLGLFSVLIVPAPFAVLFGVLAIRDLRKHPAKHGMGRAVFGIVCGSLAMGLSVVVLSAGLLAYDK
jgi:signal transduction histidine kinase